MWLHHSEEHVAKSFKLPGLIMARNMGEWSCRMVVELRIWILPPLSDLNMLLMTIN